MTTATAESATGLTTWERWKAGCEARTDEERRHYRTGLLDKALPSADELAALLRDGQNDDSEQAVA